MRNLNLAFLSIFVASCAAESGRADRPAEDPPALNRDRVTKEPAPASGASPSPTMMRLQKSLSRSREALRVEPRENGVRRMNLRGRFQHAMLAVRRPDGSIERVCVDTPEAAASALGEQVIP